MSASGPLMAVSMNLSPSTSDDGHFSVGFTGNNKYYAYILQVSQSGMYTVLYSSGGYEASASIPQEKPNGVYRYRIRICQKHTHGYPGNCSYTAVQSVTVNITDHSTESAYDYDALGRLVKVEEPEEHAVYCYDDAGNRASILTGEDLGEAIDICEYGLPDEPEIPVPSSPTNVSTSSAPSSGTNVFWSYSTGAAWYEVRLGNNTTVTVHGEHSMHTTVYTGIPIWIRACSASGCSSKVYFDGGPSHSSSSSSSSSSEPGLPAPDGLNTSSGMGGAVNIHWSAVSGASRYEIRLFNGSTLTAQGDTLYKTIYTSYPNWIRACNSSVCSNKAYFN